MASAKRVSIVLEYLAGPNKSDGLDNVVNGFHRSDAALVVRFITSRFIGDYDSSSDKVYTYSTFIDNEMVTLEIIDSPGFRNVCANESIEGHMGGANNEEFSFSFEGRANQFRFSSKTELALQARSFGSIYFVIENTKAVFFIELMIGSKHNFEKYLIRTCFSYESYNML